MNRAQSKVLARKNRHSRVRKKVVGTPERPRLLVFRSLKHTYAQLIDDMAGTTLASASSMTASFKKEMKKGNDVAAAKFIGRQIAEAALKQGVKQVVFDRGGYNYHGRVKALAEAVREQGLQV
jgi:large subunit ribosomal protein L18